MLHFLALVLWVAGGLAFVGAPQDSISGAGPKVGSVYVFDAQSGAQLAKLVAAQPVANAYLGWSVAASGTTVVAGAWGDGEGAAHVFDATSGAEVAVLRSQDGLPVDQLGITVAVEGQRVLACSDPDGSPSPSAARTTVRRTTGSTRSTSTSPSARARPW